MITSTMIFEYLKEKFNSDLEALYDEYVEGIDGVGGIDKSEPIPVLTHKYDVKWLDKLSFHRELNKEEPYSNEKREFIPIVAIINDNSVEQDIAVPHDIYQINASMTFMIEEDYIDDFYQILKNFIVKNKVFRKTFGTNSAMVTIDSGWDDSRERVRGKKMYLADMSVDILVLSSVLFSNDVDLYIDGELMENSHTVFSSETDMTASLKKRWIVEFIPNTLVTQVAMVSFFDLNNPRIREFTNHISTAQKFNQTVRVEAFLYKGSDMEEKFFSQNMFIKSVEVEIQRGTVAMFKATFVTALNNYEEGDV